MINPKQALTSFTRLYQAKAAPTPTRLYSFGDFAANMATANVVHETDAVALQKLPQQYSIHTIQELAALARIDERQKTTFLKDLGLPADIAQRVLTAMQQFGPNSMTQMERYEQMEYGLGFELDFSNPTPPAPSPFAPTHVGGVTFGAAPPQTPPPPATVNLIDSDMPPIRDQGQERGTCVGFTTVACLEYHLSRFGQQKGLDLSEQFQFWNMVNSLNLRNLVAAYPLLVSSGVCRENTWPYYSKQIPGNETQGPPPANAATEAAAYKCGQVRQLPPRVIAGLQDELQKGRLVGIGFPVYKSWFDSGIVRQYGNITVPIPGEVPEPIGHAVPLVGYADDPDYAGGGYFILRNSWGNVWGTESVFGPGYGTIPYLYVSNYNLDAWSVI